MAIKTQSRNRPPLPSPGVYYETGNEAHMRRQVERTFKDLDKEIDSIRLSKDGAFSLAMKRHQFLLMGAPGG